jgi:hypothetical protein
MVSVLVSKGVDRGRSGERACSVGGGLWVVTLTLAIEMYLG